MNENTTTRQQVNPSDMRLRCLELALGLPTDPTVDARERGRAALQNAKRFESYLNGDEAGEPEPTT